MNKAIIGAVLVAALGVAAFFLLGPESTPPEPVEATSASASITTDEMPIGRLSDRVIPLRYNLHLRIDPDTDWFDGETEISVEFAELTSTFYLHGNELEVSSVVVGLPDGSIVEGTYEQVHRSGVARIDLAEPVPAGPAVLQITYRAPFEESSTGLFHTVREDEAYALTQFEAISARKAFPSFDEPRFKVPFDITVSTRNGDVAITNTPESSSHDDADGWVRHIFEATAPLPTYLVAFAVGPYDVVEWEPIPANDIRDEPIPLRGITIRGYGTRIHTALESTAHIVTALEEYFDEPYPYAKLDIIAAPMFFGGAMENAGAITYDEARILIDENTPITERRSFVSTHSHELVHQWFGNLVTPDWWTDIWLNESFATWLGKTVSQTYWPEGEFTQDIVANAQRAMAEDSLASSGRIREPITHNEAISSVFNGIVYSKGGGVLAMYETYVGADAFREAMGLHMDRFHMGIATTDDFIESLSTGTGHPEIIESFRSFIDQPGVPIISAELDCSTEDAPQVHVSQRRYRPLGSEIESESLWQIPVCLAYDQDGVRQRTCDMMIGREQSISLETGTCPSSIMPNAGGTGYYRFALDEAGWQQLIEQASAFEPREAMALADSLQAAFRAGKISASILLNGLAALATHETGYVVDLTMTIFENLLDDLMATSYSDGTSRVLTSIYRDRYDALEGAEDDQSLILRAQLAEFLALVARDQDLRSEMAQAAAAYIGLDGDADQDAVPSDMLGTYLAAGVQELGAPFFDLLMSQMKETTDPTFRRQSLIALSRVEDPALAEALRAEILADTFRGGENRRVIGAQMEQNATADATWEWLEANHEEILSVYSVLFRGRYIPGVAEDLCRVEQIDEMIALTEAAVGDTVGIQPNINQASEAISLCAELRETRGGEFAEEFSGYGN